MCGLSRVANLPRLPSLFSNEDGRVINSIRAEAIMATNKINPKIQRALNLFDATFHLNGMNAAQLIYLEERRVRWTTFILECFSDLERTCRCRHEPIGLIARVVEKKIQCWREQADKFFQNTRHCLRLNACLHASAFERDMFKKKTQRLSPIQ